MRCMVYTPVMHIGLCTHEVELLGHIKSGEWRVRVYNGVESISWCASPYAYFTVR
jgi:hypothetical protein